MTATAALPTRALVAPPSVDVVIPVFDEEADLERSVRRLVGYLREAFPFSARVTVADNASTDRTWAIAQRLAEELPEVRAVHLDEKGRGRALRWVWSTSDATVVAYMDVDLSTDLAGLLPLVAPLLTGHSDLAIGSRLTRSSRVTRGPKREVVSRCYNAILRTALTARFSDAQCGFKAIRADRARALLPHVHDSEWFFDTELLVLAERVGLRIHEVPVDWVDDPDSRVDIVSTAVADLRGVARLARGFATGSIPVAELRHALQLPEQPPGFVAQVLRFGVIGTLSTAVFSLLFLWLRDPYGAQQANAIALLVTAVLNTAANRRWTFGVRGRGHLVRHQAQGLVALGLALLLTSGSLWVLHALGGQPPHLLEVSVLALANLSATLLRFLLLRGWVFRTQAVAPPADLETAS